MFLLGFAIRSSGARGGERQSQIDDLMAVFTYRVSLAAYNESVLRFGEGGRWLGASLCSPAREGYSAASPDEEEEL